LEVQCLFLNGKKLLNRVKKSKALVFTRVF